MDKIKIAVAGAGGFANFHIDNLLRYQDVSVCAVSSSNPGRFAAIKKKLPRARLYADACEMLQTERPHGVFICVPPDSHGKIEQTAAALHIDLYVEKPLGISLPDAYENEKAIVSSGVICSVGYQERYNPVLQKIKEFLAGQPCLCASGRWIDTLPPPLWWRIKTRSGGQIVEQTTHVFDCFRYLFGEAKVISAASATGILNHVPSFQTDDASCVLLQFENGLIASIQSACYLDSNALPDIGFQIHCPQVQLNYRWGKSVAYISAGQTQTVTFGGEDFHYTAADCFLKAIKTRDTSLIRSTYSDALCTFRLTMEAESALKAGVHSHLQTMPQSPV